MAFPKQRVSSENRFYSQADIERLQQIQRLTRDPGVNLAGVEIILDLPEKMARLHEEMEQEMDRIRQEMEEEMSRRLRKVND